MKKRIILCSILFIIVLLFIILVKTVDVQPVGFQESEIGFAEFNTNFNKKLIPNENLYKFTNVLDFIMIGIGAIFVAVGIAEWIKRKSLLKVDKEIFILAGLYVVTFALFIFFELVPLNYRPYSFENQLEASFPSSHTLSSIVFIFSGLMMSSILYKNKEANFVFNIVGLFLAIMIIALRLISGVHWLTDIIGGILIAALLLALFELALFIYHSKCKNEVSE